MRVDKTKWTKTILSEITHITMGQSPDSSSYNKDAIGLPFYQGNADFGPIHPTPRIYCDAPTRTANEHELLISVRAPIGAINITNELCCIGRGLAAIQMIDGKSYLHFIKYILKAANEELNRQGTGMTFKAISKKVLFNLTICLPTFDIQQTIASELDAIQTMIDGYKAQLADLDALAQSIFLDMFGDPVANPNGWETELIKNVTHSHISQLQVQKINGKIWVLNLDKIESQTGEIISMDLVDDSKIGPSTFPFDNTMVLYSKLRPYLNKIIAPSQSGYATTELVPFIPLEPLHKTYFVYLLRSSSMVKTLNATSGGARMPRTKMDIMKNMYIPVPAPYLQQQFAHRIEAIEKQKELIKSQLADAETLMAERMQYYFS